MGSSQFRKAKSSPSTKLDMLSDLPENMKEKILTYLPIKEAGKSSILSSKWRYTWSSIPELRLSEQDLGYENSNFVEFVDKILVLRNGPIRKIYLSSVYSYHEAYDRWILNLSRNGIREITLNLCPKYIMHSSFFSCDKLTYIYLSDFSLKVPREFKGFKLLQTLTLEFVEISDEDIERLVSSCPLLKELMLINLEKFTVLKIHALNVECLEIDCFFSDLQVCAPKLISLSVEMLDLPDDIHKLNNFARVLGSMPDLENLAMRASFLEYLCVEPLKFPSTFNRLKNISFELDFENEKKAAFLLALFQRAPNLQSLDIEVNMLFDISDSPSNTFWEKVDIKDSLLKELRTVKIVNFKAVDSIVSFVKFILGFAPQLNILSITKDLELEQKDGNKMILNKLMQFARVSPKAEIIFE